MNANRPRLTRPAELLEDAAVLQGQVQRLRALLDLQRRQLGDLEARLYPHGPGGVAARRLTALKGMAER